MRAYPWWLVAPFHIGRRAAFFFLIVGGFFGEYELL